MKKDDSIPSYSLGLGIIPQTTSVPDPSTAGVSEDDGIEDDDDGAPLRIPLRNNSQMNHELSIKKPVEKKPKEGDDPSSKKGEPVEQKKGSHRAYGEQEPTNSRKPKLTKENSRKVRGSGAIGCTEKAVAGKFALAYCSLYDELTISEYVFDKVEDVDDSEPLFDGCGDKEATRVSMATLKPGEQLKMTVIIYGSAY
ncbi:hypothetical protein Cgig2_013664 [Carnegiea gigantea]|uniref:Uncharacterized protein n=1 Tax=Carnegiea gigantea TaxID=171969 RepID=A0A9Q1GVL0_9CARY|nr:hypothetical protein Cgig2_013664 [Carnegiea gigantea]